MIRMFSQGFGFSTDEAWIPDTLRSLRSLTRSGMTHFIGLRLVANVAINAG